MQRKKHNLKIYKPTAYRHSIKPASVRCKSNDLNHSVIEKPAKISAFADLKSIQDEKATEPS